MVIRKAAIKFSDGEVIEGYNYSEISSLASKLGYHGDKIHGFVTGTDEFVLPTEAIEIAVEAGQINSVDDVLTPDMLWPQNDD